MPDKKNVSCQCLVKKCVYMCNIVQYFLFNIVLQVDRKPVWSDANDTFPLSSSIFTASCWHN